MISDIHSDLEKIEKETSIFDHANYSARTDALDFIDFHIIGRIDTLSLQVGECDELIRLRTQANQIKDTLESIDVELFHRLNQQIHTSDDKGFEIINVLEVFFQDLTGQEDSDEIIVYDNLDLFLNRLLSSDNIKEAKRQLKPEMVFYQKTPVRVIIELSKKVNRDDVFFDIGSGIGQVVILVNLICGATAIGIEYEPAFCDYAAVVASKLELKNVYFINEDARKVDFSKGTVFFLYTPFIGKMMQDVLVMLQQISIKKEIRIFTYGPCSTALNNQKWLKCINGDAENIYNLCEFKSLSIENL